MRNAVRLLVIVGALLAPAACATTTEWGTWREHPTHFASGDHLSFSVRNPEGSAADVGQRDFAMAREEGWWGKPITVSQDRVLDK